jgi:hypothetical protein
MTPTRPRIRNGLRLAAGTAWLLLAVSPIPALAQGFGPDPFRPFNSQYDAYVYPIAPGALDGIGNPSINRSGVRGANEFESYLNGMGAGNVGTRFDQLYRDQATEFRRPFSPAREADEKFQEQQANINRLYFEYVRAKDPQERAAALKKYNEARSRASRELNASGRGASLRRAQRPKGAAGDSARAKAKAADDEPAETEGAGRSGRPDPLLRRPGRRSPIPSAPSIPGLLDSSPTPSGRSRDRKPSDVLERAERGESSPSGTAGGSGRSRRTPPPPPILP